MDRSVKPGDDFFRYGCGDWIKRTKIPPTLVMFPLVAIWKTSRPR